MLSCWKASDEGNLCKLHTAPGLSFAIRGLPFFRRMQACQGYVESLEHRAQASALACGRPSVSASGNAWLLAFAEIAMPLCQDEL